MSEWPPFAIEIMLACHISTEPEQHIGIYRWMSAAGRDFRARLQECGLIDANHATTDRGREWVAAICSVPLPSPPKAEEGT